MKTQKKQSKVVIRTVKQVFASAPLYATLFPCLLLLRGMSPAVLTIISQKLFDNVAALVDGNITLTQVLWTALVLVAYYIAKQGVHVTVDMVKVHIEVNTLRNVEKRISVKTSCLPMIAYENAETMNLLKRAQLCVEENVLCQVYNSLALIATHVISIISVVAVLSTYSLVLIPLTLVSVMPLFISRIIRGRAFYYLKRKQSRKSRRLEYLWGLFSEKSATKEMRVMGFGEYLEKSLLKCRNEIDQELWAEIKKDASSLLICDFLRVAGYGISILVALYLVSNGRITVGTFGACIAAFLSAQDLCRDFIIQFGDIPTRVAFCSDYFQLLEVEEEANPETPATKLIREIGFDRVSFSYPGARRKTLHEIVFSLKRGEHVAIVGENGSGKTTLSKLLLGMYKAQEGVVMYDGQRLDSLEKASLRDQYSIVSQDFMTYAMTIRENIAISDTSCAVNDSRICEVLDELHMGYLITKDDGLDSMIGREYGGIGLSGGEQQKLAIARHMVRDRDIAVLDEPTSALDPLIETEILNRFLSVIKGKTALIISHRVGLCRLVDRIVVMREGKIVQTGTHEQLIQEVGEYQRLYHSQEQWYRSRSNE